MIRLVIPLVVAASVWYGGATWYGNEFIGRETRSGELYTGQQMTAAVSSDLWDAMKGKTVTVCTQNPYSECKVCAESRQYVTTCIEVRINDSGDADAFREHGIAIDLSPRAFREFGPLGLGRVEVVVTE